MRHQSKIVCSILSICGFYGIRMCTYYYGCLGCALISTEILSQMFFFFDSFVWRCCLSHRTSANRWNHILYCCARFLKIKIRMAWHGMAYIYLIFDGWKGVYNTYVWTTTPYCFLSAKANGKRFSTFGKSTEKYVPQAVCVVVGVVLSFLFFPISSHHVKVSSHLIALRKMLHRIDEPWNTPYTRKKKINIWKWNRNSFLRFLFAFRFFFYGQTILYSIAIDLVFICDVQSSMTTIKSLK